MSRVRAKGQAASFASVWVRHWTPGSTPRSRSPDRLEGLPRRAGESARLGAGRTPAEKLTRRGHADENDVAGAAH